MSHSYTLETLKRNLVRSRLANGLLSSFRMGLGAVELRTGASYES